MSVFVLPTGLPIVQGALDLDRDRRYARRSHRLSGDWVAGRTSQSLLKVWLAGSFELSRIVHNKDDGLRWAFKDPEKAFGSVAGAESSTGQQQLVEGRQWSRCHGGES